MDLGAELRAEAQRTDERRALVLAGTPDRTRRRAAEAIDAADIPRQNVCLLGPVDALECKRYEITRATELLGTTQQAVVVDCHEKCRPNALGCAVGAVNGGGLLVLLVPPLAAWPDQRDGFDETLAVPPFEVNDVRGHFRRRLVETLEAHRGVAIVDVDADEVIADGSIQQAPRPAGAGSDGDKTVPSERATSRFPTEAYEACLTEDQARAVTELETLFEDETAVILEADRGRGKSAAAGLAAAGLALAGRDVLVTAPGYRAAAEVFARAGALLDTLGELAGRDREDNPHDLRTENGCVRFADPDRAVEAATPESPAEPLDVLLVDEAASLPVHRLSAFLAVDSVAFATTIHGYEGAGRSFSVRFRERLAESRHRVSDVSLSTPIRYAPGDPIEVWSFRALGLDAAPPVDPLVADATPKTVEYRAIEPGELRADEHLLREVFGLLVLAHYRTEPDDLARLLDAPNLSVRALLHDGHVVSVALLAREGDLPASLRAGMYEGQRVRGNMLPDVLTSQLRDEAAGETVGLRVLRIATHHAGRSRGLGSRLLTEIRTEFEHGVDWLGVGYGATPDLVGFWQANGYRTVHLSTTRNDTSGEYSAIMLDPTSDRGEALLARHTSWFLDRLPGMLSGPLADMDADVVRTALGAVAKARELELSDWEWRVLAGIPHGAGIADTAPDALRQLTVRHLADGPESDLLTPRQERLLVRRVCQNDRWESVAIDLDFVSTRAAMRELGAAVGGLVRTYGNETAQGELERYE